MENMQNADFDYFVQNYMDFFNQYGHKFLAIKNKRVLGVYDDVITAVNTTMKSEELGTFIVQECTGDASAYTSSIMDLCIA